MLKMPQDIQYSVYRVYRVIWEANTRLTNVLVKQCKTIFKENLQLTKYYRLCRQYYQIQA